MHDDHCAFVAISHDFSRCRADDGEIAECFANQPVCKRLFGRLGVRHLGLRKTRKRPPFISAQPVRSFRVPERVPHHLDALGDPGCGVVRCGIWEKQFYIVLAPLCQIIDLVALAIRADEHP